ncbi:MAG TPA: hypothetical protein PLS68_03720 [Actinotalea sp.]|nr:hypothetical protein [Actinotalea sp.]
MTMADHSTSPAVGPVGGLRSLTPAMTTFVVVDAILVLTFLVLLVMAVVNAAPPATPGASEETVAPETTPDATAPDAPADAETLTAFRLPSGNIWCAMTETSATCTIVQFTFTPPELPEGCTGTVGNVLTVSATDGPSMPCQTAAVAGAPDGTTVLEYGQASTVGEMTCHSSTNGATCRHNPTGRGFSVARGGYTFL